MPPRVGNKKATAKRNGQNKATVKWKLAGTGTFALYGSKVTNMNWGTPPWTVDFVPERQPLPAEADFVVVGGGFSGLATAAWLREIAPERSVVLIEASRVGSGASGRTGGLALAEPAEGHLEGLGSVLGGYLETLARLGADGDLEMLGIYEIARTGGRVDSPIVWEDSGTLRVCKDVLGGGVDPGRIISGLARAASRLGVVILEDTRVEAIDFCSPLVIHTMAGDVRTGRALLATNAQSVELSALADLSWARFTLAVLTQPLTAFALADLGLSSGKGFYTSDLPYLWGRPMPDGAVMFGSGLVDIADDDDLATLDIEQGVAAGLFASLEKRVRGLHPAIAGVEFALRWGGPIRFGNSWQMFFGPHPRSSNVLVLNGLGGDGVSFSVYLGRWAAEVLAGQRELPAWGKILPTS
jgi:glycine/D-amino acid oxidase-like deaminating enzyme